MSSKEIASYEIDQIKNFENFIDKTIEQKPDILFIAGNLFGTSKPKNKTIEKVGKSFKKLSNSGIEVFLLSGSHDTPLPFSNDRPIHHIFEDIEKIHFLFSENRVLKEITEPMFKGQIKDNFFQIFSVPTPFKSPNQFEFNLKIEKDYTQYLRKYFFFNNLYFFRIRHNVPNYYIHLAIFPTLRGTTLLTRPDYLVKSTLGVFFPRSNNFQDTRD